MPESLRQKQSRFAKMVPRLIDKAFELGYEVTFGDAYRDPRLHGPIGTKLGYGHSKSLHKLRLAIDLNLFKGGEFLQTTEDHSVLGTWWESIGGTWGGRYNDGNHYCLEHEGMQ